MGSSNGMWIMLIIFFGIMYFFMIRPQQKKQKLIQKFRAGLGASQQVVTAGGVHGTIKEVNDNIVVLEIAKDVRITIEKSSIYNSAADSQQGK
jgi:preprotein translocase subunit YajC